MIQTKQTSVNDHADFKNILNYSLYACIYIDIEVPDCFVALDSGVLTVNTGC